MPCYRPLEGWRSRKATGNGKFPVVFRLSEGDPDRPVFVPCGQCVGCRLERSRQWAVRCMHEAQMHPDNSFITLTYQDEYLPPDWNLEVEHFQKFMKNLRYHTDAKIKVFYCGEYGEEFGRPHWHACLFNRDFGDKVLWKVRDGVPLFQSAELATLWPFGYSSVGALTFQSAAYVARYTIKKQTGEFAGLASQWKDPITGRISVRRQPFGNQSNGIGKGWFEKFKEDVYPHDYVVTNGKEAKPPKYYDGLYEITEPDERRRLSWERKREQRNHRWNQQSSRLRVRERVAEDKASRLVRTLD